MRCSSFGWSDSGDEVGILQIPTSFTNKHFKLALVTSTAKTSSFDFYPTVLKLAPRTEETPDNGGGDAGRNSEWSSTGGDHWRTVGIYNS